jgi:oxygen-independent coproporphyrinogen-3 oxidase
MTSEGGSSVERGGLYVHVPFCRSKCPYCDFHSVTAGPTESWVDAVIAEARQQAGRFGTSDTMYLGGGTPSALPGDLLERLVRGLCDAVDLTPDAELTIEVNPDDVTGPRLEHWLELGLNRLSLGIQSFAEDELFFLGRRHTAQQTVAAPELARAAGVENLGIDLIFGLSGRNADDWRRNLERSLVFEPEHLSCYQLTIAPETPFGRRAARGDSIAVDEEVGRELFLTAADVLGAAEYDHYEVSNFARTAGLRSRHNLKYWHHSPVLGLGPAAHSYRDGERWWNASSVAAYVEAIASGESPCEASETLSENQLLLERLMLGFRTSDGVELGILQRIPGWRTTLDQLVHEGLLVVSDGRARPTVEGYLLADGLPLRFGV